MNKINILRPTIFPFTNITAGNTLTNYHLYPEGFSIFPASDALNYATNNNIQTFAYSIGSIPENLVFQKQVHGNKIKIVDNYNKNTISEGDGLVTNNRKTVLCISLADCVGILCYDPKNNVIGAFHSGWKGTKNNIAMAGIKLMQVKFNSNPKDILVYITPSASERNYEVDNDVAQFFQNHVLLKENGKYLLNLRATIVQQLLNVGIDIENNVEVSSVCTIENKNYHSFRRDKELAGRMVAFIAMK